MNYYTKDTITICESEDFVYEMVVYQKIDNNIYQIVDSKEKATNKFTILSAFRKEIKNKEVFYIYTCLISAPLSFIEINQFQLKVEKVKTKRKTKKKKNE